MQETILYYHLDLKIQNIIERISSQLGILTKEITNDDVYQKMGYILGIEGYERLEDPEDKDNLDQEFLYFANMTDQQLEILLDVFKAAAIPFIPYKAKLTESNIEYIFADLYKNVAHEYKSMTSITD